MHASDLTPLDPISAAPAATPPASIAAVTEATSPEMAIKNLPEQILRASISLIDAAFSIASSLPYVKQHNTVLLANHGIICWADTVTHAEWYAEVVDTYCWTLMLASQLGVPISQISEKQTADLLDIKKTLGLPDARFDASGMQECQLSDLETSTSIALLPCSRDGVTCAPAGSPDIDQLVKTVTDAVMQTIGKS